MAALVLGAVGGLIGGPIGFLIGTAIGNALFQPAGPRTPPPNLQGSQYGQMIPRVYGTDRVFNPQLIWQGTPHEHRHNAKGKGGPSLPSTWSLSFATKVCKGPMAGILKIWFDGTLVYDTTGTSTTDNSQVPVTIYLGVETAQPDPTIQAVLGVGNVPAFRDDCVLVFNELDLSLWGNRVPNISVLVVQIAGTIPWRVSTFDADQDTETAPALLQGSYDPSSGIITCGCYLLPNAPTYSQRQFLVDGTPVGTPSTVALGPFAGYAPHYASSVSNLQVGFFYHTGSAQEPNGAWYVGANFAAYVANNPTGSSIITSAVINPVYQNGFIYAGAVNPGGGVTIYRWIAPEGVPTGFYDASYGVIAVSSSSDVHLSAGSNFVFATNTEAVAPTDVALYQFDLSLNLIHSWMVSELPSPWDGTYPIVYYNGLIAVNAIVSLPRSIFVFRLNADNTFTSIGNIPQETGPLIQLRPGVGLVLGSDGVVSLDPPSNATTLAAILTAESALCGLTASQIDVSAQTQTVDGYMISQQQDGRSGIIPLQTTYYVDAVESSAVVKFVNRGGPSVITIPDNDLAAQIGGKSGNPPPIVTYKRIQEEDLPAVLNIGYPDRNAAYQPGSQQDRRQVTRSQAVSEIKVAVVMTDLKARQVAKVNLFGPWLERDGFLLLTPRKYVYLEPTDVISAHGYTLRVMSKHDAASGVIQLDGVQTNQSLYLAGPAASPSTGPTQPTPRIVQSAQLLMLDMPLLTDVDAANGYYAAMAGTLDNTWRNGILYKSNDNAVTFNPIATASAPNTIGVASTVLGDWTGPQIFDETNSVTVVIGKGGGTLSSYTQLAVLNGSGWYIIGFEIVGAKNATLIAANTYVLTGLLRGRRGTEWATSTHVANERFVALSPTLSNPAGPFSEIGIIEDFKAVSPGKTLADAIDVKFANLANALKCYSPTFVGGGCDASGNVTLNWIRRTRIGGGGKLGGTKPLSEATEGYIVQIWDSSYTFCARIIQVTSSTASYTAAQQVTDFGATQKTIFFTVGQLGAVSLGAQTKGTAAGIGASNVSPLSPIAPYAWNVVVAPPPGPTRPVNHIFTWPSETFKINPFPVGTTWVGQFTTGASIPLTGLIQLSEYQAAPEQRHCFIATDTGGLNKVPKTEAWGTSVGSIFGTSTSGGILAANTTYYFISDFIMPDGTLSDVPGFNAAAIVNLGNVT